VTASRMPLFVGEVNPYREEPEFALYPYPLHSSGARLMRVVCGLPERVYLACHRTNLCTERWSLREARRRADKLLLDEPSRPWDVVVMLGCRVRDAFYYQYPLFSSQECGLYWPVTLISLPHPSGLSRAWDMPGNVDRARDLLRAHCPLLPWGTA
jgi:hypothetical protein